MVCSHQTISKTRTTCVEMHLLVCTLWKCVLRVRSQRAKAKTNCCVCCYQVDLTNNGCDKHIAFMFALGECERPFNFPISSNLIKTLKKLIYSLFTFLDFGWCERVIKFSVIFLLNNLISLISFAVKILSFSIL